MRLLHLLFIALLLAPSSVWASGFRVWTFGMDREQVQAQDDFGPYYSFKNGDLGSQAGPFQCRHVPISFYFDGEHLVRIMLIVYSGNEVAEIRDALTQALAQLSQEFGGVELPGLTQAPVPPESVVAAFDDQFKDLAPGQRFQAGAFPMQEDRKAWVSVTAVQEGLYMVAVNYAEP